MFVAFASRSNQLQIGWFVHKGKYARLRARPFAETVNHIAAHVPPQLDGTVRQALNGLARFVAAARGQSGCRDLVAAGPVTARRRRAPNVAVDGAGHQRRDLRFRRRRAAPRPGVCRWGIARRSRARDRKTASPRHRRDAADTKYPHRHHVRARPGCDAEARERSHRRRFAHPLVAGVHAKGGRPSVMGQPAGTRQSRALGTRRQGSDDALKTGTAWKCINA